MENEEKVVETTTNPNDEEKAILKAYKELQKTTVSKEKYDADIAALKEKNDIYLKAITEGTDVNVPDENNSGSIQDAISDISKFKGTNLEYWEKMTKAIDQTLKNLPEEEIIQITGSDGFEELIKVNEGMKKMVKDANGDANYFRTLYGQRVADSAPRISSEIEKEGGLVNYLSKSKK